MLLEAQEKLEEVIVRLLGRSEPLSVETLARRVKMETGRTYSIQGIYKALRGLQAAGVVVRLRKRYGLSMPWIVKVLEFARDLEEKQLNGRLISDLAPEPGQRQTWIFFDLLRMDDFWNHLIISLLKLTRARRAFEWMPHPWPDLIAPEREREFTKALRLAGCQIFTVIGGRTPLDIACSKTWPDDVFVFSLDRSPWEGRRSLYMDVIGDFIITIHIQRRTASGIDDLFRSVKTRADLNVRKVFAALTGKTRVRMSLTHDAVKAAALERKFERFFDFTLD